MKGLDSLSEDFNDIDGFNKMSDDFSDSSDSEEPQDGWTEDLDLSIDLFAPPENDDMAEFGEECARRLAAEHARRAAEADKCNSGQNQIESEHETNDVNEMSSYYNAETEISALSDSFQMMKNNMYQEQIHVDDAETEISDDNGIPYDEVLNQTMPRWLRILLSFLLMLCGTAGIWMLTSRLSIVKGYNSYLLSSICFTEIAMCFLVSVGLNAELISDRSRKSAVMKIAMWCIFLFYCLYAADILFLNRLLELRFSIGDFTEFAHNNISFDLFGDLSHMEGKSMAACVLFIMPYAFCVPVLIKSYRNIFLYFLYMTFSVLVAGTLRIVVQTGGISIAQCLMCLVGAAAAYIIFMLPPVQNILRRVGLLEWIEVSSCDE